MQIMTEVYVACKVPVSCHTARKDEDGMKNLTPICPKYHVILIRVIPTLKKVEEQVFCLKIDVACVRPK